MSGDQLTQVAMASETKGAEPAAAPAEEPELTEQQIIGHYRGLRGECSKLAAKISELESDVNEHQ